MEKDIKTITNIIYQHYLASEDKLIGVPIKSFEQRGFGHHDVRIALSILTKDGAVKDYHRCWGHNSIDKKTGAMTYDEVDTKQPKEKFEGVVPAFEAYHITIEPNALKKFVSQPKAGTHRKAKDEPVELILDNDGGLYREPKKTYCYPLHESKEPLKILLFLLKNPNHRYESTQVIAFELKKDPQYLRTEIGKINRTAANRLGLGKEKLIQAKQNSGYRLNPKIQIKAETEILSR